MTREQATKRLVEGFSNISTEWIKIIAENTGDEFYGIMWGTMFVVTNPVDRRMIEKHLKDIEDEENEMYGAQEVADTGIYAFEIDGELVLGINGAGYDFYDNHWIPLYNLLEYHWHDEAESQKVSL